MWFGDIPQTKLLFIHLLIIFFNFLSGINTIKVQRKYVFLWATFLMSFFFGGGGKCFWHGMRIFRVLMYSLDFLSFFLYLNVVNFRLQFCLSS